MTDYSLEVRVISEEKCHQPKTQVHSQTDRYCLVQSVVGEKKAIFNFERNYTYVRLFPAHTQDLYVSVTQM